MTPARAAARPAYPNGEPTLSFRIASDRAAGIGPSVRANFRRFLPRTSWYSDCPVFTWHGRVELRGLLKMVMPARGVLDNLRRIASQNTDKQVREWRRHWERGADARWFGTSNGVNPYPSGSSRASAWSAGWSWAEHHADRRKPDVARLAHRYRRNSDTLVRLVRRANRGAVGVSALTMIAAVWRIRRRRGRVK